MITKLFKISLTVSFIIIIINTKYTEGEKKVEGKNVVVTGGAQGIGFAVADNFLKNGAKAVIILDINVTKGEQAERELNSKYGSNKAYYIECDVTKDLNRVTPIVMKKYKFVEILVNAAGIINEKKPRKLMKTNAIATIEFSLAFNEYMRKDKGGKGGAIINIASIVAHYIDPTGVTYKASKFAVSGFSQSLGQKYNYKKTGVRVLTICPGVTNTRIGLTFYKTDDKKVMAALAKGYNYKTLQSADFVGKSIVELFKTAETGTSWDIENKEPPFESSKTLKVIKIDN